MMNSPFSVPATDLAALLQDAGFTETSVQCVELTATFQAVPDFGAAVISAGPIAALFNEAPAASRAAVAAAVTDAVKQYTDGEATSFPMYSNVATGRV